MDMSSISSLSRAISALRANEQALNTTAHNLANVNTTGYVRQQVLMKDSSYLNIGNSATGTKSIGFGVDVEAIRQVRDIFLDQSYRNENGRYGYYTAQSEAVDEIQTILGETEGESFSKIIDNLWTSINELSKHPDGLETRGSFIQNAVLFAEKSNLVMEQLNAYQSNLNQEISKQVNTINNLGRQILKLNQTIVTQEVNGGNANDYRDQRNKLLDDLSKMANISYREDAQGAITVSLENVPFVIPGAVNEMGTTQSEPLSPLIDPCWPHLRNAGPPAVEYKVFNLDNPTGPQYDNDRGYLKGLIMSRGTRQANYTDLTNATTYKSDIEPSLVMTAQAQFDQLIHGITTMINNVLAPNTVGPPQVLDTANAPYGLDGAQGVELFKREYMNRYDGSGNYNVETSTNEFSLYSAGKLVVNPAILADYDKLCLSTTKGVSGDSSKVTEMLNNWKMPFAPIEPGTSSKLNYNDYYTSYVFNIGNVGNVAINQMKNQELMSTQIDNQRLQLAGVSSDEELTNMLKYQNAYNAAAKVVTVVDDMLDKLISNLGLVGR